MGDKLEDINDAELAQAYEGSQGGYPDNISQYSAARSGAGNGNPNKLPGIPTGAIIGQRPKVPSQLERNNSVGSANVSKTGQVEYQNNS